MSVLKQKRGRKSKLCQEEKTNQTEDVEESIVTHKKRGRKPKGGKIIYQTIEMNDNVESKPNIILHLKCSLKDLTTNINTKNANMNTTVSTTASMSVTSADINIESYNFASKNDLSFEIIETNSSIEETDECENYDDDDDKFEIKETWKKLKQLEHNLHINNICDKKSACFWCTCEFDNPCIYIPKHFIKASYHVYGCFCSPECACAFLMNENIDSSTKFERYYLLNHIYSKIYNYEKNIKPAPTPYFMLDKYYGNLTIQEYRMLFRNERLFFVVEKPLTRVLPELHEDNNDFIITNKIIPSNKYQIKKKTHKKLQTKNTIVNEKFGLVS
jgi:hypothetical protein